MTAGLFGGDDIKPGEGKGKDKLAGAGLFDDSDEEKELNEQKNDGLGHVL